MSSPSANLDDAPVIVGASVRLRPLDQRDFAVRASYGRSAEVVRGFGGLLKQDVGMTMAEAESELGHRFGAGPHWAIADNDDQFIGVTRLAPIDTENRAARFGIGILDATLLGQGLGTEVARLVVRFAFDNLRLHRVSLTVLAENERAICCYRNVGFVEEGRLRHTLWRDEAWHDDVVMAVLKPLEVRR